MGKPKFNKMITIVAGSLVGMHFANKYIDESSSQKQMLRTDTGHFFQWQYGKVFYTKEGSGTPLILIHDLSPDSSGMEWKKVHKELSQDYTVYTVDLPGCGRSDKPNLTYTNFLFVELLNEFIRKIVNQSHVQVMVTGDSSSFAIMAANLEPSLYSKLTVINPPRLDNLCASPRKELIVGKFILDLPVLGTFLYNVIMQYNNIDIQFNKRSSNRYQLNKEYVDTYYESAHLNQSNGRHLLSSKLSNYTNINICHAFGKLQPDITLLLSNQKDGNKQVEREYKSLRSNLNVYMIPNSKWFPQLEVPNQFLETFRK